MVIWAVGSEARVREAQAQVNGAHCHYLAKDCGACFRLPNHKSVPEEYQGRSCPNNPFTERPEDYDFIQSLTAILKRGDAVAEDLSDGLTRAADLPPLELVLARAARRRQVLHDQKRLAHEIVSGVAQLLGGGPSAPSSPKPGGRRGHH